MHENGVVRGGARSDFWRYYIRENGVLRYTGQQYPTKESLLSDMDAVASSWGFPVGPASNMFTYDRVLAMDLRKESVLLRCLGRLATLVATHRININLVFDQSASKRFLIEKCEDTDGLFVSNLYAFKPNGSVVVLRTPSHLNSEWPLLYGDEAQLDRGYVFLEDGSTNESFQAFLEDTEIG